MVCAEPSLVAMGFVKRTSRKSTNAAFAVVRVNLQPVFATVQLYPTEPLPLVVTDFAVMNRRFSTNATFVADLGCRKPEFAIAKPFPTVNTLLMPLDFVVILQKLDATIYVLVGSFSMVVPNALEIFRLVQFSIHRIQYFWDARCT
jgi:hypothetical protein